MMLSLYHLGGEGIAVIVSILVAPARSMVLSQVNPPMDNGDIENYAESSSSCTNYCIIYYRISSFAGLDYDSFRCLYDLQSIEGGISLPILLDYKIK